MTLLRWIPKELSPQFEGGRQEAAAFNEQPTRRLIDAASDAWEGRSGLAARVFRPGRGAFLHGLAAGLMESLECRAEEGDAEAADFLSKRPRPDPAPREAGAGTGPRRRPLRFLVGTAGLNVPGDRPVRDQLEPFTEYGRDLNVGLGLTIVRAETPTLDALERAVDEAAPDVAMVLTHWSQPGDAVTAFCERVARRHPETRLIFLDYYAPTSSPHFGVLPFVDLYVKRQVLRDRGLYQADWRGGTVLTDYLAGTLGLDLDGWHFGVRPDPAHVHKVVAGWNLGVTSRNRLLLRLSGKAGLPWEWRPLAFHRRINNFSGAEGDWYQKYRQLGLDRLEPLARSYRASGVGRVSRRRYTAEMMLSRIVFSPFGWGEICFRDYEAVSCGALLVKPSMNHLETNPDVFIEGETYVPVRWDFADLEDTCHYYLSHPDEARRIVENARRVLSAYLERGGFLAEIERILARVPA